MTEILTESFCERCGTRYTFESARPKARLGGVKVLSRGLKNFVLSDDTSMDEAMAAARNETDREQTAHQLDAFHKTFNFCMSCRQYTCPNCWNEVEARCLSCAPNLGRDVLPAPFPDLPTGPLVAPDSALLNGANGSNGSNGAAHPAELIGLAEVQGAKQDAEVDAAARLAALTAPIAAPVAEAPVAEPTVAEQPVVGPSVAEAPMVEATPVEAAAAAAPEPEAPAVQVPAAQAPASQPATKPADSTPATPPDPLPGIVEVGIGGVTPATDGGAFDAAAAMTPFDETEAEDLTDGDKPGMAGFAARLAAASGVAKAADAKQTKPAAPDVEEKAAAQTSGLLDQFRPAPEPLPVEPVVAAAPVVEPEIVAAAEPVAPVVDAPEIAAVVESPAADTPERPAVVAAEVVAAAAIVSEPEPEAVADVAARPEPVTAEPEAVAEPVVAETEAVAEPIIAAYEPEPVVAEPEPVVAEPEPVAAEPAVAVAPEMPVVPEAAAEPAHDSLAAAAMAEPPAAEPRLAAPEPPAPAPVADDVVRQPVWQMVAPDTGEAPIDTPPPASSEPQWPARPEWPAAGSAAGLPFLGRPATPQGGLEALWAESTREVVAAPTPSGRPAGVVQPCVSCGLSLSANARFCRRCGTAQGG